MRVAPRGTDRGWRLTWLAAGLVPAAFLVVFFAWPAATLVARGFHDGQRWSLDGFARVFSSGRTWRVIGFTLRMATISTVLCVLLGLPGAYVLYRLRWRGRALARAVVAVPFVLPTVVVGVAFTALFDGPLARLGLTRSFTGILLALIFFNYAVIVRSVGTVWRRLDRRLGDAAATLGASPLRSLVTVTIPALGPAIAAGAALVFLFCASAYGIVMVMGGIEYSTIETEIWYRTTQLLDLRAAAALSVTQLVVVTLCLLLANLWQRRSEQALRLTTADEGQRPVVWRRDWPAIVVTGTLVVALLLLPMVTLAVRSLRRDGAWTLRNYRALAAPIPGAGNATALGSLWNSAWIALTAALISLVLGAMVALVSSRRPASAPGRTALRWLESAFVLPLGVSAVTVGFGYLITLNHPPLDLRSSPILVPIAQAVVALPLVVRSLLPSLRAIDRHQLEAARTLGSSEWAVLRRIEIPQLLAGLGLAAGFALATSLGEFGATSFLSRADNPTMPVLIYRLLGRPGADPYGTALAAATVLAVLTAMVMALAEWRRPKGVTATW